MGMILADTTVWVDHFRKPEPGLLEHLAMNGVLMHPMVIGELSCGNLPHRKTVLRELLSLPRVPEPTHESVLSFIESKELMGRGVGFIDFHLLCSVLRQSDVSLWTRDNRLNRIAGDMGIAFSEGA